MFSVEVFRHFHRYSPSYWILFYDINMITALISLLLVYIRSSLMAQMVKNPPSNAGGSSLIPGSGRSPGEVKLLPIPVFLPGESHGQNPMDAYCLWGCKELDTAELLTCIQYT